MIWIGWSGADKMTQQRASAIIEEAKNKTEFGPWSDQLTKVMTREERLEVNRVWDTMPGHTCFIDALFRVAKRQES